MKRLKLFALLALLIIFNLTKAQPQKKLWSLPGDYVKFNPTLGNKISLPPTDYNGTASANAHNAMHDVNGNLLFFITDEGGGYTVYDKDGRTIGSPTYNSSTFAAGSEISIVPVPGECQKYYLIFAFNSCLAINCIQKFGYITLDMSLLNTYGRYGLLSNGGVATLLKTWIHVDAKFDDTFFAVTTFRPTISGGSRILFAKNNGLIWKFLITQSSITEITPYSGAVDFTINSNSNVENELEVITLANGNYRLGIADAGQKVAVADFYPTGQYVANSYKPIIVSSITDYNIYGLEFDLTGRYLYFAVHHAVLFPYPTHSESQVGSIDLAYTTPVVTIGSVMQNDLGHGQIELGYDGIMHY